MMNRIHNPIALARRADETNKSINDKLDRVAAGQDDLNARFDRILKAIESRPDLAGLLDEETGPLPPAPKKGGRKSDAKHDPEDV